MPAVHRCKMQRRGEKRTRVASLHGWKIQEEERECTQRNRIYRPTIFGAPCREDMHIHVLCVRRMWTGVRKGTRCNGVLASRPIYFVPSLAEISSKERWMLHVGRVPRLRNARCAVKVEYLGCGTLGTLSSRSSSLDASPLTTSCSSSTQRKSLRRSFLRIKDTDRSITARSLHHRYDALIPQTLARVFLLSLGRAVRRKAGERIKLIGRTSPP